MGKKGKKGKKKEFVPGRKQKKKGRTEYYNETELQAKLLSSGMGVESQSLVNGTASPEVVEKAKSNLGMMIELVGNSREKRNRLALLGIDPCITCEHLGMFYYRRNDYNNSLRYYKIGADLGDGACIIMAAEIYREANNDFENFETYMLMASKIEKLHSGASEEEDKLWKIRVGFDLGNFYSCIDKKEQDGLFSLTPAYLKKKDPVKAKKYYFMALKLGKINAGFHMIKHLANNAEEEVNILEDIIAKCPSKYGEFYTNLAHMYYTGEGCKQKNMKRSIKLYKSAILLGDSFALHKLYDLYVNENLFKEKYKFLKSLIEGRKSSMKVYVPGGIWPEGTPQSIRNDPKQLGTTSVNTNGTPGCLVNVKYWAMSTIFYSEEATVEEKKKYLFLAAKNNVPNAIHNVGIFLIAGIHGFKKNVANGLKMLKKSMKLGIADSAGDLGYQFKHGVNGFTKDAEEARKYFLQYKKISGKEHPEANNRDSTKPAEGPSTGYLVKDMFLYPQWDLTYCTKTRLFSVEKDERLETVSAVIKTLLDTKEGGCNFSWILSVQEAKENNTDRGILNPINADNEFGGATLRAHGYLKDAFLKHAERDVGDGFKGKDIARINADALFMEGVLHWDILLQAANAGFDSVGMDKAKDAFCCGYTALFLDMRSCSVSNSTLSYYSVQKVELLLDRVMGVDEQLGNLNMLFGNFGGMMSLGNPRLDKYKKILSKDNAHMIYNSKRYPHTTGFEVFRVYLHLILFTQENEVCLDFLQVLENKMKLELEKWSIESQKNIFGFEMVGMLKRQIAELLATKAGLLHRMARVITKGDEKTNLMYAFQQKAVPVGENEQKQWETLMNSSLSAADEADTILQEAETIEYTIDMVQGIEDVEVLQELIQGGNHLDVGTRCKIVNLTGRKDLNDCVCTIKSYIIKSKRYCVVIQENYTEIAIKRLNLLVEGDEMGENEDEESIVSLAIKHLFRLSLADRIKCTKHLQVHTKLYMARKLKQSCASILTWRVLYLRSRLLLDLFICIHVDSRKWLWNKKPESSVFGKPGLETDKLQKEPPFPHSSR